MITIGIGTIIFILVITGLVSALGGYFIAQSRQRRVGGGKNAAELVTELSDYKSEVGAHFEQTAALLGEMTERYRGVYEHIASGARELCDTVPASAQLESLHTAPALPAEPDAEAIEEGIEEESVLAGQKDQEDIAPEPDTSAPSTDTPLTPNDTTIEVKDAKTPDETTTTKPA